jgi:hypothetical protein
MPRTSKWQQQHAGCKRTIDSMRTRHQTETAELTKEIDRLNRLVETLSRALGRYQDDEIEVGGDAPADHPYQRRGSWSGDDWCTVEGCTSKASAHHPPEGA